MSVNNYIEAALAVHAAASVITALTPTPKDDAFAVKATASSNCALWLQAAPKNLALKSVAVVVDLNSSNERVACLL